MRRREPCFLIGLCCGLLLMVYGAACSLEKGYKIEVQPEQNANRNFPIAVDFVLVHDETLMGQLAKMTAQEWFDTRAQLLLDYPENTGFTLSQWEWVPDASFEVKVAYSDAEGAFIFADYFAPGTHRATIDPDCQAFALQFGEESFTVEYPRGNKPPCL